jgi:hypothetical protein
MARANGDRGRQLRLDDSGACPSAVGTVGSDGSLAAAVWPLYIDGF